MIFAPIHLKQKPSWSWTVNSLSFLTRLLALFPNQTINTVYQCLSTLMALNAAPLLDLSHGQTAIYFTLKNFSWFTYIRKTWQGCTFSTKSVTQSTSRLSSLFLTTSGWHYSWQWVTTTATKLFYQTTMVIPFMWKMNQGIWELWSQTIQFQS